MRELDLGGWAGAWLESEPPVGRCLTSSTPEGEEVTWGKHCAVRRWQEWVEARTPGRRNHQEDMADPRHRSGLGRCK